MPYGNCLLVLADVSGRLEAYYGVPQKIKKLEDVTSVYMTSNSLFKPDTIIKYEWELPQCKKLEKESLFSITIEVSESNQDVGVMRFQYSFSNSEKVLKDKPPF